MESVRERRFAREVRELRRMSTWWREWAAGAALAPETIEDGDLCLQEAAGNIVRHGVAGGATPGEITVALERMEASVRITISDNLAPFDPLRHPDTPRPDSLEELAVGGLGIYLMRRHATGLQYRREHELNVLTIVLRGR